MQRPVPIQIDPLSPGVQRAPNAEPRAGVWGKFLHVAGRKFYVRGVAYGPFHPDGSGSEYHSPDQVDHDFAQMVEHGANTVRTYTVPPAWLLDCASDHGLKVMVGLPWEQHVAFLEPRRMADIERRVRAGVRACAQHPAVLCYAVGNEIPAQIVRWYGARRIERFLKRLYDAAKAEDPEALVTYVSYPTTEYLHLPFIDLVCYNVYLESQDRLGAYLARLHNLAGNRPLVITEVGLDSRRHGEEAQAAALEWQIRTVYASGCAGTVVFSWTDEWYRGGCDVDDWDFGLTDRNRQPKPALARVAHAFSEVPFPRGGDWPRISVVVCTHNGAKTIRDCMQGLQRLEYPDYEVIVVSDGSSDATEAVVREYGFRLIRTEHRGLSNARNLGLRAASGEIVAYIDDDAYPDPDWLTYLAVSFRDRAYVGMGGPNLAPPGDGFTAACVARAPGGPVHVLLSDREAEHLPGCNMAFRTAPLQALGGFDPQFRTAGDDVDICWRLRQSGHRLGFSPAALVWHHPRRSVRAFWRQQANYGVAEAMLQAKFPENYNALGHLTWRGRLYGDGSLRLALLRRWRVYHGVWGSGLFQSVYDAGPSTLAALPLLPEWSLVIASLVGLAALGLLWTPLLFIGAPLALLAAGIPIAQAVSQALNARHVGSGLGASPAWKCRSLIAALHLLQPQARLVGRLRVGLTPWRWCRPASLAAPWPHTATLWSESWQSTEQRLGALEATLRDGGAVVRRGGDYDRWDLEVRGGLLGGGRARMTAEEHGGGKQLVRIGVWPRCSPALLAPCLSFAALGLAAGIDRAWAAAATLLVMACVPLAVALLHSAAACGAFQSALAQTGPGEVPASDHVRQREMRPAWGLPGRLLAPLRGTRAEPIGLQPPADLVEGRSVPATEDLAHVLHSR